MKPHTFAGRVIQKHGRIKTNDFEQPQRFFNEAEQFCKTLHDIPFTAVEEIGKFECNRDIMLNIVKRVFQIFEAAKLDVINEMVRLENQEQDPFHDLEEDIAHRNKLKITARIPENT